MKPIKLTRRQLRSIIKETMGHEAFEPEEHAGTPDQLQHELHEMMEGLIAQVGAPAAYEAVMAAWESAAREVASGVDRD